MLHGLVVGRTVLTFMLGVASARVVMEVAGDPLRRAGRALAREAIRSGLVAARGIKRVSDSVVQDVEDLTAEVRAELDRDRETEAEGAARATGPGRGDDRPRRSRRS